MCRITTTPSIVTWGISSEITIVADTPGLYEQLSELNDMVHDMDKTRPSVMAQVSMLPVDSKHNLLTDFVSCNHYFG